MRARSLARRWALTPPFHPYPFGRSVFCATFRGSLRAAVNGHPALWSPDFPLSLQRAITRLTPAHPFYHRAHGEAHSRGLAAQRPQSVHEGRELLKVMLVRHAEALPQRTDVFQDQETSADKSRLRGCRTAR